MNTELQSIAQTAAAAGLIPRAELTWPARANGLQIVDAATLAIADEERGACKDFIKKIHAEEDPVCKSAWDNWQLTTQHRATRLKPFEEGVEVYDRNIKQWERDEVQRARDAQRAIEQAAYAKRIAEQEKVVEHVETTGGTVGEVRSAATAPTPLPIGPAEVMQTPSAPRRGKTARVVEDWKGEVTDLFAFVNFALLGTDPPKEVLDWVASHARRELVSLLQADKIALGSIARSTKGTMEVPGLRIWDEGKVTTVGGKVGA